MYRLYLTGLVFLLIYAIVPLAIGCEPYQAITYENITTTPVKVTLYELPLEYTGTPTRTWYDTGDIIGAGKSQELIVHVLNFRSGGIKYKYAVVAVTETNGVIFSKTYTWDELHDLGWRVVISSQEPVSSNTTTTK